MLYRIVSLLASLEGNVFIIVFLWAGGFPFYKRGAAEISVILVIWLNFIFGW